MKICAPAPSRRFERHWTTPRASEDLGPLPAAEADRLARAALEAMLTRPFRVGVRPGPEIHDQLLRRVRWSVGRGRPIRITLGFGPMKNPNGAAVSRADWAEFFALCHLIAWHNKVQSGLPAGAGHPHRLRRLHADHGQQRRPRPDRLVHRLDPRADRRAGVRAGLAAPDAAVFVRLALSPGHLRPGKVAGPPLGARSRSLGPDRADGQAARRNLALPPGLDPKQQERFVAQAAHRYRVYWEALQLSHLTHGRRRLVAMYLDGSQHHIRQPVALHLTTWTRGRSRSPGRGREPCGTTATAGWSPTC